MTWVYVFAYLYWALAKGYDGSDEVQMASIILHFPLITHYWNECCTCTRLIDPTGWQEQKYHSHLKWVITSILIILVLQRSLIMLDKVSWTHTNVFSKDHYQYFCTFLFLISLQMYLIFHSLTWFSPWLTSILILDNVSSWSKYLVEKI